jgi:hypothetical protein
MKKMKGKIMMVLLITTLLVAISVPAVESLQTSVINSIVPSPPLAIMGDDWTEMQKLLASDGGTDDTFGVSVSLDGGTALIGAPQYFSASAIGYAYVFTRTGTTWAPQAKLLASDGAEGDLFGYSVSLDGDTAFVGAPDGLGDPGSVYVFTRTGTTWTQQQKLTASDGEYWDGFGSSVSISGDTAIIGAFGWGQNQHAMVGSAYVFTYTGTRWTQKQKLTPSHSSIDDDFGVSVSLDGNTALIGAEDYALNRHGYAYVFTRTGTTWTEQQMLDASDSMSGACFGVSVSLDGNTALIGASNWDATGDSQENSGSAYVFTRTGVTWTQQAKIRPSDPQYRGFFGQSVSLDGDTALVGAIGTDEWKGSAYVFTCIGTTWTQQQKLTALDGEEDDAFGCSVSLDGDTAIIGAYGTGDLGEYSGSAYVFTKESVNQPPNIPSINGEARGKVGVEYTYTASTTDPEGDEIQYFFDWGDGTNSGWQSSPTASHIWNIKGKYAIKVKARDQYGADSDWATLSVTMPRSKTVNMPFLNFLEQHPNLFPILQKIVQRLKLQS